MDYILYFFLFSFLGCVLETFYATVFYKKIVSKQTLMKLPLCPLYGVGGLALLFALKPVEESVILTFCGGFFVASSVEYLVAVYYELLFNVKWWDYSDNIGNVNGKVCVKFSLIWGIVSVLFFKFIFPPLQDIVSSINIYTKFVICILAVTIFVDDYKNTLVEIKKYSRGINPDLQNKFVALKKN